MPRLNKKTDLLLRFEEAVKISGWNLLHLGALVHPARLQVYSGVKSHLVKVYIWNITHGGGHRDPHEFRIQITTVDEFQPETGAKNLVLGWWEDVGVFAGWDIRQHMGPLGKSPSMQVSEGALRGALLTGFAPYVKSNGETAIAFRPDFMGAYIEFLEQLHDSGTIPAEADLLASLSEDPDEVTDERIEENVQPERKFAILETKRALRAIDFRRRVLSAYDHRCAMCGIQLRLVDGAHVLPAAHPESTDQTSNGLALCALHHRAYDRALVTFDDTLKVYTNGPMLRNLKAENRAEGLKSFRAALRPMIFAPADKKDRPAPHYVEKANQLRGWNL